MEKHPHNRFFSFASQGIDGRIDAGITSRLASLSYGRPEGTAAKIAGCRELKLSNDAVTFANARESARGKFVSDAGYLLAIRNGRMGWLSIDPVYEHQPGRFREEGMGTANRRLFRCASAVNA